MVIVLGSRYPDEKCLLKVKEDILDWLNIIFFTNIKLLFMHVLSIGSLYKEYFLLKHEDSPVPHANCSSQDFLRNVFIQVIDCLPLSLRPARHVLV